MTLTFPRDRVAKSLTKRGTRMVPKKSTPPKNVAAFKKIPATVERSTVPRMANPVTTAKTMSPSTSSMTAAPRTTLASRVRVCFRS